MRLTRCIPLVGLLFGVVILASIGCAGTDDSAVTKEELDAALAEAVRQAAPAPAPAPGASRANCRGDQRISLCRSCRGGSCRDLSQRNQVDGGGCCKRGKL